MEFNKQAIEEKTIVIEEKLKADREQWGTKISDLVSKLKDVSQLADVQVFMLSYRPMLLDKSSEMKGNLFKRNGDYEELYQRRFRYYTLEYDIKLTGGEKEKFVKADLMPIRRQINILESHIEFYSECIRTLDNMAFAIKNRITIHTNDTM